MRVKRAEVINNVQNIPPNEAKAILSGLVEMWIHFDGRDHLNEHVQMWNYLAHSCAINSRSLDRPENGKELAG